MKHEAEEVRQVEKDAQKLSAEIAADMIKHPRSRWIMRPLRRLAKWVERNTDEWLKDEGWR